MEGTETMELLMLRSFLSPATLPTAGAMVSPEHMRDDGRRAVAQTLTTMFRSGELIAPDTLALRLQEDHDDTPEDAEARIAHIMAEEAVSDEHLRALMRTAARNADRQARAALAQWLTSEEGQKATADAAMAQIAEYTRQSAAVRPDSLQSASAGIANLLSRTEQVRSYAFGFGKMDDVYRVYPGSFNVVMADSGAGKTSMMLNMATNLAKSGTNAYVFSIEMDKGSVHARIAAIASGVTSYKIDDNNLTPQELEQIQYVLRENKATFDRIYVDDPVSLTAEAVHGMVLKAVAKHGPGVVFIDYLGLLSASGRHINNEVAMQAQVSKTLTMAAKATGIPIIALSQITTTNHGMDQLKGSKQAKHDGWTMLLLERAESEPEGAEQVILTASVVKNRKRPNKRKFPLVYNLRTQRIFFSDSVETQEHL